MKSKSLLNLVLAIGFACCLPGIPGRAAPAGITIADKGQSSFSIVLPRNAPASLEAAAQEFKQTIALATKAQLPIVKDDGTLRGSYISLGATAQAQKAGISAEGVALEGFRIVTKDGNLYILGPDTPNGALTPDGGTSNGSANGVYSFLQDYLDVRWLMPGDLGRDVPTRATFTVGDLNRTEAPYFLNRRIPYIQNGRPAVKDWEARQRLGYSFRIIHWHNWPQVLKPEYYDEHPDWFPLIDGKRQKPRAGADYKIETTNPEVVELFADAAIAAFKKSPEINTYPISPSDGEGWSQSPESKALYDTTFRGKFSVTPLILKFYNDVALAAARKDPKAKLAGYIYSSYLYPPSKGDIVLPDNFYPVIAPSINYGYQLYRDESQADFARLMPLWSKITPHLFYYDLPNSYEQSAGTVQPVAPELLNIVFKSQIENNVKGTYIYGNTSWSNFAMGNTILAQMMWNPRLDAHQLQTQWLHRAYGPRAGAAMDEFYQQLDRWWKEYYRTHPDASYKLSDKILQNLYAVNYPEMEKLFLNAKAQPMTEVQQKRLQLIEENLIVLQWRLRNAKFLPASTQSALRRSNEQIGEVMLRESPAFELYPGMVSSGPAPVAETVQLAPEVPATAQTEAAPVVRHANVLMILPGKDGEVRITPQRAEAGNTFILYSLKTQANKQLQTGLVKPRTPITFQGKANTPYYFYTSAGITQFQVEGAATAYRTNLSNGAFHLFAKQTTALYFYVPSDAPAEWSLKLMTFAPLEAAKVTIYTPEGDQAAVLETGAQTTLTAQLKSQTGFWKVVVDKAAAGGLDDVYLTFDKQLPQWVSIAPQSPLIVLPKK